MSDDFARQPPPPGYRTQSEDTAYWADRLLFEHLGTLTPVERLEMVRSACVSIHQIALASLRRDHPGAADEELEMEVARRRLGDELFGQLVGAGLAFWPGLA